MKYHIEPCTEELDIVSTADQCKVLSQIKGKWKEVPMLALVLYPFLHQFPTANTWGCLSFKRS